MQLTQETADFSNPQEHIAWGMRNMPCFAGTGMVTHEGFLREWSAHLVAVGFVHTSAVAKLADENGMIHVSQLPKQQIVFQPPFRGPSHGYNNAARWVPVGTQKPKPFILPDVRQLTQQENDVMIQQYKDIGLIRDTTPGRDTAQELM